MEKRSTTRFYDEGSVICSIFNAAAPHDAQMLNFSPNGMCFRTYKLFKPGTTVTIRLNRCPRCKVVGQEDGGLRSMTLARVQWCQDDENPSGHRFMSGVQYF